MLGGSKGVCPLGCRTLNVVREGKAASREKTSERWKGEGGALSPPRRIGKAKSSMVASGISKYMAMTTKAIADLEVHSNEMRVKKK
jgi:hypothetical protein